MIRVLAVMAVILACVSPAMATDREGSHPRTDRVKERVENRQDRREMRRENRQDRREMRRENRQNRRSHGG